ncbi:MAG: DMT family transporter, partial [Coriobacteriales bacterium]|nr:DMT family transporter [Coriobacteriales bacterium]
MPIPSARRLRSSLLLLLTALIWGLAFVAQRFGMDYIGPFLFVALRMLFGAVTLLIVLWLTGLFARRKEVRSRTRCDRQAAQRD